MLHCVKKQCWIQLGSSHLGPTVPDLSIIQHTVFQKKDVWQNKWAVILYPNKVVIVELGRGLREKHQVYAVEIIRSAIV